MDDELCSSLAIQEQLPVWLEDVGSCVTVTVCHPLKRDTVPRLGSILSSSLAKSLLALLNHCKCEFPTTDCNMAQ